MSNDKSKVDPSDEGGNDVPADETDALLRNFLNVEHPNKGKLFEDFATQINKTSTKKD